jgi:hypothetical protein
LISSTPTLEEFIPLPQQLEVIKSVRQADYNKGMHEFLLSGSVGSTKSLTLAHLAITHCLIYPNANFMIGRLALPQLKATLCNKIKQHASSKNFSFRYNETTGDFKFTNGSKITAITWADKNFEKLGSFEFSAGAIEELIETKTSDAYDKVLQRIGRLPHIRENFLISATNPSGPQHWAYKKIIEAKSDKIKVFYSNTFDNPYLPRTYIEGLLDRLDDKQAQRQIYGRWVEIETEVIYYQYDRSRNFKEEEYKLRDELPIYISCDFNIAIGKPMSWSLSQKIGDEWHVFDEAVVESQSTPHMLDELAARGLFEKPNEFRVRGDAAGKSGDTRSNKSDYDIIDKFLSNYQRDDFTRLTYKIEVPKKNPPIRERHNTVNAYFMNANGHTRLYIYKKAKYTDEGFRLTRLKEGSQYQEHEDYTQHITTAVGYCICYDEKYDEIEETEDSFKTYQR